MRKWKESSEAEAWKKHIDEMHDLDIGAFHLFGISDLEFTYDKIWL
jgi:hypothetical protein